jgi:hypothetical protein
MSASTPLSKFIIDDIGIGLVIVALVLGIVFWKKRSELSSFSQAQAKEAG